MSHTISINHMGGQLVPGPRPTDAIGGVLRRVFGSPPMPDDMARLLQRVDRMPRG